MGRTSLCFVIVFAVLCAGAVRYLDDMAVPKGRPEGVEQAVEVASPRVAAAVTHADIVRIPRHRDGHYYADLMINRRDIYVLVDTGASVLALRDSDAEAVGLYPKPKDFRYTVSTANGETKAALMTAKEIELGPLLVKDAEVFILPDENLDISLLGMNVLSELGRLQFDQTELVIERLR